MTLPATAQAIYDLLVADETISDGLGTYTFADGNQVPAIAALFDHEHLPPGTLVEGIEITITRMPLYGPQTLLSGGLLTNPNFRIYVVAWQSPGTLQAMTERVLALLPGSTARQPSAGRDSANPPGAGLGLTDQVVVSWTNPTAFVEA